MDIFGAEDIMDVMRIRTQCELSYTLLRWVPGLRALQSALVTLRGWEAPEGCVRVGCVQKAWWRGCQMCLDAVLYRVQH